MKLVRWEFMGLHMPMIEDEDRELYCTSKAICEGLGIKEVTLRTIAFDYAAELNKNCVANSNAIQFVKEHKVELGLKYVRGDMRLWTEDDMLTFAFHAKSPQSLEFRRQLRQFIKKNATRGYVSQEQFDQLKAKLDTVVEIMQQYMPAADQTASLAGSMLRAQRDTKHLRIVNFH